MESGQKFPWQAYKEELRRLFLAEDKSLSDVMAYMENEHNFRGRYLYINPQNDHFR
jgi:Clr5 domain